MFYSTHLPCSFLLTCNVLKESKSKILYALSVGCAFIKQFLNFCLDCHKMMIKGGHNCLTRESFDLQKIVEKRKILSVRSFAFLQRKNSRLSFSSAVPYIKVLEERQ